MWQKYATFGIVVRTTACRLQTDECDVHEIYAKAALDCVRVENVKIDFDTTLRWY